jgi:hypothetical protein
VPTLTASKRSSPPFGTARLGRITWRRPDSVPDDGKSGQRPLGQIDVEWIVGQWFEGFDRFELVRQKRALAKMKVSYRLGTRRFRQARGRKPKVAQTSDPGITRDPFARWRSVASVLSRDLAFLSYDGLVDAASLLRAAHQRSGTPRSEGI